MRFLAWIVVLGLIVGIAYWALATSKPVQHDPVTGQVQGGTAAPGTGGYDPGTVMNNAKGAAGRIQDDAFRRAAEVDGKTAP